jgi:hypothetical protein
MMWLPREERQLLIFYAAYDADLHGNPMVFSVKELGDTATRRLCAGQIAKCAERIKKGKGQTGQQATCDSESSNGSATYMKWLNAKGVIESANSRLKVRGLIGFRECGTGQYEITLNLSGWGLGRKYSSWWERNVLWFREYKDHWIWLIVGFIGGICGALVVQWLSK